MRAYIDALDALATEIATVRQEYEITLGHDDAAHERRAELLARYALLEETTTAMRRVVPESPAGPLVEYVPAPSRLRTLPAPPPRRRTVKVKADGSWWTKPGAFDKRRTS